MTVRQIQLGDITFANDRPFALLGGVNVLEDLDFALRCAGHYKQVCERLGIPLVFKAPTTKPIAPQFIPSVGQDLRKDCPSFRR